MANHNRFGEVGEELAVLHLQKGGFSLICTNWRAHRYEIDIIAQRDNVLHFVEVKTRSVRSRGSDDFLARNAVGRAKLEHLLNGVQYYIDSCAGCTENRFKEVSLDLISVDFVDDGSVEIEHIPNFYQ